MKKRILFVDDEASVLDGLRRLLHDQREAWDMSFAGGVDEAVQKSLETEFDAIVSDITMPEKDGFELLRILRNTDHTRDVPIVILTGLGQRELKSRALDMGATDLLNKPVDREDLLARLRNVIRLKSYQDEIKAHSATLERKIKERTRDLADSRRDIILRLANVTEHQDRMGKSHGLRVGCYSRVVAEALGLDKVFVERLFLASPLHDIGQIAIPEKILWKQNILTFEEWEILRQHCAIGHAILGEKIDGMEMFHSFEGNEYKRDYDPRKNPILKMAAAIALTHHEWWNGKGYPNGLKGEEIPIESRIVALTDEYDELTSDRPYRKACSESEALTSIRKNIGEQFDPEIYPAFDKSIEKLCLIRNRFARPEEIMEDSHEREK